jgi:hypothetical protein
MTGTELKITLVLIGVCLLIIAVPIAITTIWRLL